MVRMSVVEGSQSCGSVPAGTRQVTVARSPATLHAKSYMGYKLAQIDRADLPESLPVAFEQPTRAAPAEMARSPKRVRRPIAGLVRNAMRLSMEVSPGL